MRKVISLFQRNYGGDHLVRDELVPGAEWVAAGEGIATRKFDGTCCLFEEGRLWKRYELKRGKVAPAGFVPSQEPDAETGHQPGWQPIGDGPEDAWHREALQQPVLLDLFDGCPAAGKIRNGRTYELCGPKVQGGAEGLPNHRLIVHGTHRLPGVPRTFDALRAWFLDNNDIEGIVWHHADGRMVKIKLRDFGLSRIF